jgi:hypothetical protein
MVIGMATKKVTITLQEEQLGRIHALVQSGSAASVSGFVQHAVGVSLDDVAGWGAMLADAMRETGGEMTAEERRWANEVLDAGALIALDRSDRRVLLLMERARETGARITIPATALAQAVRRPERQVRLARLVRQPVCDVVALDRVDAVSVGRLLAAVATSDVIDAHVVICARRAGQPVVTADPSDLRALDPTLRLVVL